MEESKIKRVIVASYLSGKYSYRELVAKHGYSLGTIHSWVKQYDNTLSDQNFEESIRAIEAEFAIKVMPTDLQELQEALREAQMHNKLLSAMIDIAEETLHVPIRKKHGARQS